MIIKLDMANTFDKVKHRWNINFVLSALPIYQFPVLLVPASFCHDFVWELHRFLLKGGKSNSKHFHLVNWNIILSHKTHGGLGIRDPLVMNKALREKIIWRLISRKKESWKSSLSQKYFLGPYMRFLDNITHFMACSQIWHLLKASPPLLSKNLSWSPGNRSTQKNFNIALWDNIIVTWVSLLTPDQEIGLTISFSMCKVYSLDSSFQGTDSRSWL
jgi:hypothetical protein